MSNKILKLGLLIFITVVVIVCAGCTSKTSSDVAANTKQDDGRDIQQQDNNAKNSKVETSSETENSYSKNNQEELRTMEPYVDSELAQKQGVNLVYLNETGGDASLTETNTNFNLSDLIYGFSLNESEDLMRFLFL